MKPRGDLPMAERTELAEQARSVMRLHEGPLLRYAARLTGCGEAARDVVQDTFLKWIRARRNGNSPQDGKLPSWLFTVCRNQALDVMRKDRRMTLLDGPESTAGKTAPDTPSPGAAVENGETHEFVLAALAELPGGQKEVLRLKYQNDFTYRQIAEITGRSVSHVGVLIHTGMQTLRNRFQKLGLLD